MNEAKDLLDEWSVNEDKKLPSYWVKAKDWQMKRQSLESHSARLLESFAKFCEDNSFPKQTC